MAWTTPKTDWIDNQYFTMTGWNRICDNIKWLIANKGTILSDMVGIGLPILSSGQIPTTRDLNGVVDAVNAMIDFWISPVGTKYMRKLQDDEMTWTAADLNAIETNIQILHDELSKLKTWVGIAEYVRSGRAKKAWSIGTQFTVGHTSGTRTYVVMGHDMYKSVNNSSAHTMTLMMNSVLYKTVSYSTKQAFYYAETALPAGQYHFRLSRDVTKWKTGDYQFTLTKQVPAGGQLVFSSNSGIALTSQRVDSYSGPKSTTYIDHVVITSGTGGTDLGTLGYELNDPERSSHGSNNYMESPIRQYLNSNKATVTWTAATKYDRYPTWFDDTPGYIYGFDTALQNVLGECIIPCAANAQYEAPDSTTVIRKKYQTHDKVTIPSAYEMFGDSPDISDGSAEYEYYSTAPAFLRGLRAQNDGVLYPYILRTPVREKAAQINLVDTNGEPTTRVATTSGRLIVPVINIV